MSDIEYQLAPLPEEFVARLEQIISAEHLPGVLASFAAVKPVDPRQHACGRGVADVRAELVRGRLHADAAAVVRRHFTVPAAERGAGQRGRAQRRAHLRAGSIQHAGRWPWTRSRTSPC
ncbi:MAG: hypothetical protein R2851_15260 [Caldilineaceae bacterium]